MKRNLHVDGGGARSCGRLEVCHRLLGLLVLQLPNLPAPVNQEAEGGGRTFASTSLTSSNLPKETSALTAARRTRSFISFAAMSAMQIVVRKSLSSAMAASA
eukprot:130985-Hanusia_phi.AAC.4